LEAPGKRKQENLKHKSMYNIIPLILILISLSIITVIVARKFSALASLDVDNIPAEKEAKFKERLIGTRFKRHFSKASSKAVKISRFVFDKTSKYSKTAYNKLYELKDRYGAETMVIIGDKKKKIKELISEADEYKKEEFDIAERKLINIIGLDSKNVEAFESLGNLYLDRKNFKEAKETFLHLLKLLESEQKGELYTDQNKAAGVFYNLSIASSRLEENLEAFDYIKKALEIEPKNPRYLDTILETSIINKDKDSAESAFKTLEEVNPDNKKLEEFEKEIKEL
jgi:tetratricopeptide (TPR) repeat protein